MNELRARAGRGGAGPGRAWNAEKVNGPGQARPGQDLAGLYRVAG